MDEGVRRAYLDLGNQLRPSIVANPAGARTNTRNNTPAVMHVQLVTRDTDAAHKRIADHLAGGTPLPAGLAFTDRFI